MEDSLARLQKVFPRWKKGIREDTVVSSQEPQQDTSNIKDDKTPIFDIYDARRGFRARNKAYSVAGSNPKLEVDIRATESLLRPRYKKAKDDSEYLNKIGDKNRAKIVEEQYIEDAFLPAIESLVLSTSASEVLNNKRVLETLDKYATLDSLKGTGYTASFIRAMHNGEDDGSIWVSDSAVCNAVRDIKKLASEDRIRECVSLAKRIKSKIENGDNVASEDDWELIQKVALR